MSRMISKLFLFYMITIVLTGILSMVQEKLKIDAVKIIIPQLAPTIAFVIIIQIFSTLKTPLNIQVEKNTLVKAVFAFFMPVALLSVGFCLSKATGVQVELTTNMVNVLPVVVGGMFIGAIGEEIGWRGFLQPNLEKTYSITLSSIIVGLFWGLWHIGNYKNGMSFMFGFLLFTISASIVLRWLIGDTGNNLILSILFHLSINIGFFVFYKNALTDSKMILTNGIVWAIPAVVITIMTNRGFINYNSLAKWRI